MQLLIEEFFTKIFKYINEINILIIRTIVKFVFYLIFAGTIAYIILSSVKGNHYPLVILLGILVIGEVAHYLRKTREKVMTGKATEENSITEKPENKTLLKTSKPKNETLLKKSKINPKKIIQKKILIKKTSKTQPKTISKKISIKKTSKTQPKTISTKPKIDNNLLKHNKPKNKTLLKISKPKNKDLLKGV